MYVHVVLCFIYFFGPLFSPPFFWVGLQVFSDDEANKVLQELNLPLHYCPIQNTQEPTTAKTQINESLLLISDIRSVDPRAFDSNGCQVKTNLLRKLMMVTTLMMID